MKALFRAACSNIRANKAKYFGISLMFLLTGLIIVTCVSFRATAVNSRMELLRQSTLNSQLRVVTKDEKNIYFKSDDWVRKFESVSGVRSATARIGGTVLDEKRDEVVFVIGTDLAKQNQTYRFEFVRARKNALHDAGSLFITRKYAKKHGLHLGSRVTLARGSAKKEFTVTGILKNNERSMESTDMYAQMPAVQTLLGQTGKIYAVGITIRNLRRLDVVSADVRELLDDSLTVETSYDLSQYENTIEMVDISFKMMTVIAIILAMFLCFTLYKEFITERTGQLGGLKCLGVSEHQLGVMYGIEYAVFSVPSLLLGFALAKPLLELLMRIMNQEAVSVTLSALRPGILAAAAFELFNPVVILGMLHRQTRGRTVELLKGAGSEPEKRLAAWKRRRIPCLVSSVVLITALAVWRVRRDNALLVAAFLAGTILFLAAAEIVLSCVPDGIQFFCEQAGGRRSALVSVLSSDMPSMARNTSVIVLSVALCTACLAIGSVVERSIGTVYGRSDLILTSFGTANGDQVWNTLLDTGCVKEVVRTKRKKAVLKGSSMDFIGIDPDEYGKAAFEDASGEPAAAVFRRLKQDGTIVLSNVTAHRLHLSMQDRVRIRVNGRPKTYRVTGIVRTFENMGQVCFVSNEEFRKTGDPDYELFLIASEKPGLAKKNRAVIRKELKGKAEFNISTRKYLMRMTDRSNQFLFNMIYAMIAVICVVAVSGLLCNLALEILRRNRKYAIIRVLGTRQRFLTGALVLESLLLAGTGCVLGELYGNILSRLLVRILNNHIGGTAEFAGSFSEVMFGVTAALCVGCALLCRRRGMKKSSVLLLKGDE